MSTQQVGSEWQVATSWKSTGWRLLLCLLQVFALLVLGLILGPLLYTEIAMWLTVGPRDPNSYDPERGRWIVSNIQVGVLLFDAFLFAGICRLWWQVRTEFKHNKGIAAVLATAVVIGTLYAVVVGYAFVLFAPEGSLGHY